MSQTVASYRCDSRATQGSSLCLHRDFPFLLSRTLWIAGQRLYLHLILLIVILHFPEDLLDCAVLSNNSTISVALPEGHWVLGHHFNLRWKAPYLVNELPQSQIVRVQSHRERETLANRTRHSISLWRMHVSLHRRARYPGLTTREPGDVFLLSARKKWRSESPIRYTLPPCDLLSILTTVSVLGTLSAAVL